MIDVLVVGATGSMGSLVVAEALGRGHRTRALVRDLHRTASLPEAAVPVVGDRTDARSLAESVDGVDAVVFTHRSPCGAVAAEAVDDGAVSNVLTALGERPDRVALMTAISVTRHTRATTGSAAVSAWCAPAAGRAPWCAPGGSTRATTTSTRCCCRATAAGPETPATASSRASRSLRCWWPPCTPLPPWARPSSSSPSAARRPSPLEGLFAPLRRDVEGAVDGVLDTNDMLLAQEPAQVLADLEAVRGHWRRAVS